MSEQRNAESLLGGYRVLDLADEKGILCGRILGDLGADVIKIERPGGDRARNIGPFYHDIPHPEKSLFWFYTNFNKRGITLNIETADGREIFKRLVKSADFVVESFKPGYMDSLGLGYSALEEIKPGIILTSITPFGQSGPYRDWEIADIVAWALGGRMYLDGDPDRPPVRISAYPQAYFHGGLQGALGSMVAHYYREAAGEGQHVDVSIQEAVTLTLLHAAETWDLYRLNTTRGGAVSTKRRPPPAGDYTTRNIWPCKDGHILWSHALAGGAQAGLVVATQGLIQMMERDGMAGDLKDYDWTQFDTSTITQEELDHQAKIFGNFYLTKTKAELLDEAVKRSILLGPVLTVEDIVQCPQLAVREYFVQVQHPELGDVITYPGAPVKISEAPWRAYRHAPLIGEHNQEVYEKELGCTSEQLRLLKACGVI